MKARLIITGPWPWSGDKVVDVDSEQALYDAARKACHEEGLPWYDPHGKRHDPPKRNTKAKAKPK